MSYDVYIGEHSFNYTFNVSKLFYDHIPDGGKGGGLRELDGITGKASAALLFDAFERIEGTHMKYWRNNVVGEPEFCALYDSPNGWGSTVGALIFLSQILGACAKSPRKRVRVSM